MRRSNIRTQEISLKDELDLLQRYLDIERIRFGDRLTVTYDIEAETLDARVPSFLLQPLVENAIEHGIAPMSRPGRVIITPGATDAVALDGGARRRRGARATDALEALQKGIGLSNTRVAAATSLRARTIASSSCAPGRGGLSVRIVLPWHVEDRAAAPAAAMETAL